MSIDFDIDPLSELEEEKARQLALEEIFLVLILQEDRQESSQG